MLTAFFQIIPMEKVSIFMRVFFFVRRFNGATASFLTLCVFFVSLAPFQCRA